MRYIRTTFHGRELDEMIFINKLKGLAYEDLMTKYEDLDHLGSEKLQLHQVVRTTVIESYLYMCTISNLL